MPLPIPGPGRPPVYSDPDEMWNKGLAYFTKENKPWAISELAEHLNLSYWCFCDYEKKPAFHPIVKRLKGMILTQAEKGLYDKDKVTGSKFHASVLGMREVQVIESTSQNTNLNVGVSAEALKELSDAELDRLAEISGKLANPGTDRSGEAAQAPEQNQLPVPGHGEVSA